MDEKNDLIKVGKYDLRYNELLSIDIIKKYSKNVLVGVKLEKDGQYLYVSSMYDIQGSKISRRLYSGRIKNANIDNDENE